MRNPLDIQNNTPFDFLSIKPCWRVLLVEQINVAILMAILFTAYFLTDFMFNGMLLFLAILCLAFLLAKLIYLSRIEYVVTGEQIIYLHGVISLRTDYMELYRVVDYQQQQSAMEQMTGLKTVIIMSQDRNLPVLRIIGVERDKDVVQEIRRRVEYNRKMKRIYEIANSY